MPERFDGRASVTAADVARHAGTSTAVVSYVVNDGPRPVSAATKQRVLDAINALGYQPNRVARALRSASSGTIGIIVPDIRIPYFGALAAAIEQQAFAAGRLAFVANSRMQPDLERSQALAFAGARVDAIIIASSGTNALHDVGAPIIHVHHGPSGDASRIVRADDRGAGALAARHILTTHVERVVILCPDNPVGPVRERLHGATAALRRAERLGDCTIVRCPYDRAATSRVLADRLGSSGSRLGIIALTDEHAMGALAALHRRGLMVPTDATVVTIDGTPETATTTPALTAVAIPISRIAEMALAMVVDKTVANGPPLAVELIVRESTG
jgi:LacI family transcriptional regulator